MGSLHLGKALSAAVTNTSPDCSPRHRGLLYVDEVNLLHDHLVDLLLDAAAMGRPTVERDGVSVSHASRFILVGTMNPEEGSYGPSCWTGSALASRLQRPATRPCGRRSSVDVSPSTPTPPVSPPPTPTASSNWPSASAGARLRLPKVALDHDALLTSPRSAPRSMWTVCVPT